jgi:hypothetical protein
LVWFELGSFSWWTERTFVPESRVNCASDAATFHAVDVLSVSWAAFNPHEIYSGVAWQPWQQTVLFLAIVRFGCAGIGGICGGPRGAGRLTRVKYPRSDVRTVSEEAQCVGWLAARAAAPIDLLWRMASWAPVLGCVSAWGVQKHHPNASRNKPNDLKQNNPPPPPPSLPLPPKKNKYTCA